MAMGYSYALISAVCLPALKITLSEAIILWRWKYINCLSQSVVNFAQTVLTINLL